MTLVVVDSDGVVKGTLTDGDIRRGLVAGIGVSQPLPTVMNSNFSSVKSGVRCVGNFDELRRRGIKLLPVINSNGTLADLIDLSVSKARLPLSALIMAGGRGERMRPATLTIPKPLLPLGGKPIIDYTVELMHSYGIEDITVAVRYLGEQIIEHFADTDVKCVTETAPLGTIGALSLVESVPYDNILVMNSDLYTDAPIDEMLRHHIATSAAITVAAVPYVVSVPYAILATDGSRVTALEEKPTYSYYANAGIYIVNHEALKFVVKDEPLDATDLIERVIAKGLTVSYFPLSGKWIDIGTPADFSHATEMELACK